MNSLRRLDTKEPHIISMMLLSAFAIMGALVMTPSLPKMSTFFGTSVGTTQLAVTVFLLGYAIGQLVYGPIANRYGRKPAFYIGILLATLGSLFSILSSPVESFSLLIFGRFLEALGASAGLVVSITVINDFYTPTGVRKIMAWIMLAFSVVPGFAILLGGFIAQFLNWQSCFYFLLIYGLVLALFIWRLPETIEQHDPHALKRANLIRNYLAVFKNKYLLAYGMIAGFSSALLYIYGAEGPFVGIQLLSIPAALYGSLALIPYLGTVLGSCLNMKLNNVSAYKILHYGIAFETTAAVVMLIFFEAGFISVWSLFTPMILLCIGHSFVITMSYSLAMQDVKDKANGSAVLGFMNMSMPVMLTLLLGLLQIHSPTILPALLLLAMVLMILIYLLVARR